MGEACWERGGRRVCGRVVAEGGSVGRVHLRGEGGRLGGWWCCVCCWVAGSKDKEMGKSCMLSSTEGELWRCRASAHAQCSVPADWPAKAAGKVQKRAASMPQQATRSPGSLVRMLLRGHARSAASGLC